jgi:large subunit ribosomal protein L18
MERKGIIKNPRLKRHKRIRRKISGSAACPRLCVFRSLKHIYAQLIDDEHSHTLLVCQR